MSEDAFDYASALRVDDDGYPMLVMPEPAVALATPAAPVAPRLCIAESVEILTLAQCAIELSMTIEDAERTLVRASTPRVVGFPRSAIEELGARLHSDPALRAELGVERGRP